MLDFGFYNRDCMDGMREFPDKYFDLAIVDPPYGAGSVTYMPRTRVEGFGGFIDRYDITVATIDKNKHKINKSVTVGGRTSNNTIQNFKTNNVAPRPEYFDELFRISKNQIIWGANNMILPPTRCFIVWRKTNIPLNGFSMAAVEYAWTSFDENAGYIEESSANGTEGRVHPTQKPVALYEWILTRYARDADIILDTHVGSASSLIACHNTGHKFVGFELDPDYYAAAKARLEAVQAQTSLFDMAVNE